jgi:deoxycytidylate deaminase
MSKIMKRKVTAVILTGLLVIGVVGIGECSGGKRTVTERFIA